MDLAVAEEALAVVAVDLEVSVEAVEAVEAPAEGGNFFQIDLL